MCYEYILMLEDYFAKIATKEDYTPSQIGYSLALFQDTFPNLDNVEVAIFGLRKPNGLSSNCNTVRSAFYRLANTRLEVKVADLGDIKQGESVKDTSESIVEVCCILQSKNIIPVFIGDHMDQAENLYKAFQQNRIAAEVSLISDKLPMLDLELLNRICTSPPNFLTNISAIGFQAQYLPKKALDTLENLNFNHLRLGELKQNIENAEVCLRNAGITIFDINAIQHSDAPGKKTTQPSGLSSEEACQLARYAGLGEENKAFAITDYNYTLDHRDLTATLCAHIIWYYLDGYSNRTNDSPGRHNEFIKYRCDFNNEEDPILFIKSKRTQRWWMQIEHPSTPEDQTKKLSFPCTYADYQMAANGETPQRYLDALKKLA